MRHLKNGLIRANMQDRMWERTEMGATDAVWCWLVAPRYAIVGQDATTPRKTGGAEIAIRPG